jgi:hypothetical protein
MFGAGLGDDLEADGVDAVDPRGGVQDLRIARTSGAERSQVVRPSGWRLNT